MPAYQDQASYFLDTFDNGSVRNYTYLYDKDMYTSMFVAYPLYSDAMGSYPRPSNWYTNPNLTVDEQINVWSGSYGVSYGSTIYSRGHLIPNSSRNGIDIMQKQTFYATNSVPQIQDFFNGGIWSQLETGLSGKIQGTDTVYVVTGVSFRKVGGNEPITYIQPKHDTKQCPVPNYFWKVALKVTRSGGNITAAKAIGFWMEHRQYFSDSYTNYTVSVDQIEQWTGLNFFANLPTALQATAETNTNWTNF